MFTILDNIPAFLKALTEAERGVGFAKVVALTRTARATAAFLGEETGRVFDRPTPFTRNAFWWRPATPDRSAFDVGVKDFAGKGVAAAKYLRAEIFGGARRMKRSEIALGRLGRGQGFWVPGPGIKLDAYGNVPGALLRRIISDVKADSEVGYLANRTGRSRARNRNYRAERYFVPSPSSPLHPGVWVERPRGSRKIMPALLFVGAPHYRKRFDFFGRGMKFATERFPVELAEAIREGWHLPKGFRSGGRI